MSASTEFDFSTQFDYLKETLNKIEYTDENLKKNILQNLS